MNNIQIFQYNDNPISFLMGGENRIINATQMAKNFGKRPVDFLKLDQTKAFLAELSKVKKITLIDLVIVKKGGNASGTWMQEDVALEFARWLSPMFGIWCNDRIKELLRFGLTATEEMLLKAATDPGFVLAMMEHIKESREKNRLLAEKNKELEEQAEQNAGKVQFYDNLQEIKQREDARKIYSVSQIAHELGLTAAGLNRLLIKKGVTIKIDGSWYVSDRYKNFGYAIERQTLTKRLNDDDQMELAEITYLKWTSRGREFIHSLIEK